MPHLHSLASERSCLRQHLPIRERIPRIADTEEDEDARDSGTSIQGCSKDVIVLGPPCEELVLQPAVEDPIDQSPGAVIDAGRRRDVVRPYKNEWPIDLSVKVLASFLP